MTDRRDFRGYFGAEPAPCWPDGARLAVSFVVNVEEGSELSIGDGDPRNEFTYEIREEVEGAPDLCMETHFAYGTRQGYARIADAFDIHGVKATFSTCGRAAERSPWLMRDIAARGHEISCHGWLWQRHANMTREDEAGEIARTHAAIKGACGTAPVGWHTRSSASVNTRDLLIGRGDFLYDSDVYDDDIPRMQGAHVILPYAFDTNDMRFSPGGGFVQARDFSDYVIGAFDRLYAEGATAARMMSIGLHLRLIGRPGRIKGLEDVLGHIAARGNVWIAPRRDIAAHWASIHGERS
ncbi:MAG: chitin deacetylase [Confluentimicrobium sp.]|jgi:allantoinase|uniref:allantoinase PuuE n=1 Tax=Actibacterium sp. TaxID=1872125 RepID=UPI000C3B7599|nr:allantoinase PuuE [Actibacterium sp.]MBC57558.1 chitin deacetylase [Actibacterium sp.]|tara:strand:- start:544 stop:1431 length:888 start_codon:yes stop_codon:yes gene_type:complete